ncbi:ribonuclease P protein component [Paraperlucidibaca baekdonensis]|uniref:Ribonuclease P protein component n=1 Tax=Paraperlucidibaca baekdonensis TaxID=748120 RepID=A0A3E0H8Z3_9GAMM|nr:ribonuclease P protein component [Paraperlucidibaca baekdonensis]REH40113.1 ribonuclease P protein component [Paraperlucidibaca baekdonensis]
MTTQRFTKDQRLLTPADFKRVMDGAEFKAHHSNFLLLAKSSVFPSDRIGFIIAKKKIKLAVDRNRVKRCVRDTFRRQPAVTQALDIVFLAKPALGLLSSHDLHSELAKGLQQLHRKYANTLSGQ